MERDLLGVTGFAIPNILCLTGDPISRGDEPKATAVNDVDSAGLVAVARRMRDEGLLPSGREIKPPPRYFIGVADMPFDPTDDWRPTNLLAKIAAGADFAQLCWESDAARAELVPTACCTLRGSCSYKK